MKSFRTMYIEEKRLGSFLDNDNLKAPGSNEQEKISIGKRSLKPQNLESIGSKRGFRIRI